jgi:hypothetical protein
MINLIDHLWQFEVRHCHILPTAIKISKEQPKAYFYSEKQNRVLRKKEHSEESVVCALRIQEVPGQQFLVFRL